MSLSAARMRLPSPEARSWLRRDNPVRRRAGADGPPQPRARPSYPRRSVRNACRRSKRRLEVPRPSETTRTFASRMALMWARSVPVLVLVTGRGAAGSRSRTRPAPPFDLLHAQNRGVDRRAAARGSAPWRTTDHRVTQRRLDVGVAARTVPTRCPPAPDRRARGCRVRVAA